MSLADLERRIQILEDIEAIKTLKSRYAQALDGYLKQDIGQLFTEDAVWDLGRRGSFKGRQAIRDFFKKYPAILPFRIHYFVQSDIKVEGQKAEGKWYMWLPASIADGRAVWSAGIEDDKYEKINTTWLVSEMKLTMIMRTPYEEGWHKTKYID